MTRLAALLLIGTVAGLFGASCQCGGTPPAECSEETCGGCCTAEGFCAAGTGQNACGAAGAFCVACGDGLSCSADGNCVSFGADGGQTPGADAGVDAGCSPVFAETVSFGVDFDPWAFSVGDLDGEDGPDLAVAHVFGLSVLILYNDGAGGFSQFHRIPIPGGATATAIADLRGDGRNDVIVLNAGTVSVIHLDPGQSPQPPIVQATSSGGQRLWAGDLNADGQPDVVTFGGPGSSPGYQLEILLNDSGTLVPSGVVAGGRDSWQFAASDVNGDGLTDFLLPNQFTKQVEIALNQGDGGFLNAAPIDVGLFATGMAAADLNGDQLPDFAVSEWKDKVATFLGQGDGTYAPAGTFAAGPNPVALAALDADGDGRVDIASIHPVDGRVRILRGNGQGGLKLEDLHVSGPSTFWLEVADVDGDGRSDLVTSNQDANTISVLRGVCP